jgi:hypothetical protein
MTVVDAVLKSSKTSFLLGSELEDSQKLGGILPQRMQRETTIWSSANPKPISPGRESERFPSVQELCLGMGTLL